ncbi:ADP-ribose glycohydrolase OARD1 isoform X2 [Tyto alba]|uniref:ADP-ribose glycohydrolase OARD1 isoform X2 n=1 Tax=Tyto alba TaxID=56313 RepID=UPI001C67103E|nr:ADP-ribose glycohydrolase OARD1 isoform X2 [Tyto alba]
MAPNPEQRRKGGGAGWGRRRRTAAPAPPPASARPSTPGPAHPPLLRLRSSCCTGLHCPQDASARLREAPQGSAPPTPPLHHFPSRRLTLGSASERFAHAPWRREVGRRNVLGGYHRVGVPPACLERPVSEQRRPCSCGDKAAVVEEEESGVDRSTGAHVTMATHFSKDHEERIKCVKGDLFSCPPTDSLAHCISEDCRMGAGIAVLFKKKFGGVQELLDQRE